MRGGREREGKREGEKRDSRVEKRFSDWYVVLLDKASPPLSPKKRKTGQEVDFHTTHTCININERTASPRLKIDMEEKGR